MASPPTLPISNQHDSHLPPNTLTSHLSLLTTTVRNAFSNRRPWLELLSPSSFAKPNSLTDATSRLRKNLSYFRVNYASLVAISLAFSLVSHPFSLLLILSLLAAWLFLYSFRPSDQPLVIGGRVFSGREVLGVLVASTVVVVFMTSVGSLLISALLVGVSVVCTHGAFRVPEDLFLDEQEPVANSGYVSFLGGTATAAAAPVVAGRV